MTTTEKTAGSHIWWDSEGGMTISAEYVDRIESERAELLQALRDLVTENDKYGGCPVSSPAWEHARQTLAEVDDNAP